MAEVLDEFSVVTNAGQIVGTVERPKRVPVTSLLRDWVASQGDLDVDYWLYKRVTGPRKRIQRTIDEVV